MEIREEDAKDQKITNSVLDSKTLKNIMEPIMKPSYKQDSQVKKIEFTEPNIQAIENVGDDYRSLSKLESAKAQTPPLQDEIGAVSDSD